MITSTELTTVDPYFYLRSGIDGRIASIQKEWDFCSRTTNRNNARRDFALRAHADIAVLHQMGVRLDIPSSIPHILRDHGEHLACAAGALATVDAKRDATQVDVTLEVRKQFRALGTATEHKQRIFGLEGRERIPSTDLWMIKTMEKLKSKGAAGRIAEHRWRMIEEIEQRAAAGWYIVFNTLTVADWAYNDVFAKGSNAWRFYVQEVDRAIGTALYGTTRAAHEAKKENPFHSYFGVVERGGMHGRLHIHVIHCMREIPGAWKLDPNQRKGPPINRQIYKMKKMWKFGHSKPYACRFSDNDSFGKLGWCWPADKLTKKPIVGKPPIAIARYMSKYLVKSYSHSRGGDTWRTRISNGFGLTRMRATLETIDRETLWKFLNENPTRISVNGLSLPFPRLRLESLRSLLKVNRNGIPENVASLSKLRTIRKSLTAVSPQPPIGERLQSLTRKMTAYSWPNTITLDPQLMSGTGGSDVGEIFRQAFERPITRFASRGGTPRN